MKRNALKANTTKPNSSRFKKNLLKKQLTKESKMVSKDSMNILKEFELLSGEKQKNELIKTLKQGEKSGFIKKFERKKFMESLHSKNIK